MADIKSYKESVVGLSSQEDLAPEGQRLPYSFHYCINRD